MNGLTYKRGFTLVETMIVVSIVGLLASLGIPNMLQAGQQSRSKRFAREIQTASHAFMEYAMFTGDYPPDKTPGVMPQGMSGYLSNFPWGEKTTIGGQWDWDYKVFGITAAVSVKSPNWSPDMMREIDDLIDDGNLSTGKFRTRGGGYMLVIEEGP